jgi:lipopolysaccharide export system permease protein
MRLARTLSGYIARQFLIWCGGVFGAMLVIIFLLDYIELLRRGATKPEATLGRLLEMAALKLPHMAQEVLPFAVLFGTMMAFWRLTRSNELVVARAAGVSAWQFLTPAVISALAIGVVAVTVFNPIASAMQAGYEGLEARILRGNDNQFAVFRSGLWLRETDEQDNLRVIHADRVIGADVVLENATIFFFRGFDRFVGRIDAAQAKLEPGQWRVSKGWSWEQGGFSTPFEDLTVPTGFTPSKIRESFASPETMSFWELPGFIRLLDASGFSSQKHRLYFNALLARPFLYAAMVLIAAAFSLRMQRRGGATLMIGAGVAAGFALYFLSDVVFALGLSASIPISLAAWTPTGVTWLLGATLLLHLEDG